MYVGVYVCMYVYNCTFMRLFVDKHVYMYGCTYVSMGMSI